MLDLCAVDAKTRGEIEREIAKFQAQSCRVLGFAHRHISDKDADTAALDYAADRANLESGMMFDGFVAIVDPLREDVPVPWSAAARRASSSRCSPATTS